MSPKLANYSFNTLGSLQFVYLYVVSPSSVSSAADLSATAPSTSSHIWLLCITMVMTLLEGQR